MPRFSALLAVILVLCCWLPAGAFPPLPSSFYGTVSTDGANVAAGTIVSAWIDGQKYAEGPVTLYNAVTMYSLDVPGDDPGTPAVEGGKSGDRVSFHIGDQAAAETGTWQSGTSRRLDITRRIAGIPAVIALDVRPDALLVDDPGTALVTATVRDLLGQPVPNVSLRGAAIPAALGTLGPFAATDAGGQSSASWTPGATAGYGRVSVGNTTITATAAVTLNNPLPTISSLGPAWVFAGSPGFSLAVSGTHFVADSAVYWNGESRPTVRVDASTLLAAITGADLAAPGPASVYVVNRLPGGGASNHLVVDVLPRPGGFLYLPVLRRQHVE